MLLPGAVHHRSLEEFFDYLAKNGLTCDLGQAKPIQDPKHPGRLRARVYLRPAADDGDKFRTGNLSPQQKQIR
jgi:hypothetical protein